MRVVPAIAVVIFMIFGSRSDRCREHRETDQGRHQISFGFHGRYLYSRRSIKDATRLISRTPCNAVGLHNREYEIGKFGIPNSVAENEKRQRREEVNARSALLEVGT